MKKPHMYEISSDNIFEDLALENPAERLAKAELAMQINMLIKKKKLTQVMAAQLLQIDQPKISALKNGKLAGFSLERLFRFLNMLDHAITIQVKPKSVSKSKTMITVDIAKIKRKAPTHKSLSERASMQLKKKNN
ncbi:MAG: helix-turn-helix transcriptional regulator [Candidatus Babeliales bacterium]